MHDRLDESLNTMLNESASHKGILPMCFYETLEQTELNYGKLCKLPQFYMYQQIKIKVKKGEVRISETESSPVLKCQKLTDPLKYDCIYVPDSHCILKGTHVDTLLYQHSGPAVDSVNEKCNK